MRRIPRLDIVLSSVVVLAGCGDGGCNTAPLPGGALPADQTIEGGGQIRVTRAGFETLTSLVPAVVNDLAGEGFCIGQGSWGNSCFGTDYCNTNVGGACGTGRGCDVDVHVDFVELTVPDESRLRVGVQLDVGHWQPGGSFGPAQVHLDYDVFCASDSCDMDVLGNNIYIAADILFETDPTTGELEIHALIDDNYDLSGVSFDDCGFISEAGDFLVDFIESSFGRWLSEYLQPALDDAIRGALPDPLGIEGVLQIGDLLAGVSPGTSAALEVRGVPGGYARLRNGGASLGLITGLNSDEDPSTRGADLDSEPHYCVPPIDAPDFSAPPASLPRTSRGTFTLAPAEEFLGSPEPAGDVVLGLSETTLDLAGHHAVTSGMMCLGVGTGAIAQLNLGTFGLLVPSLSTLGEPENPVLLVTRPQKALDLSIGDGTEGSPALTVAIDEFEVDIYAFIYERYTRVFTMKVDLSVGVNAVFEQQPGESATVTPELVGLDADDVVIEVLNNEFLAESDEDLESTLPVIFDLAVNLLGGALSPIEIPEIATFTLNDLRIRKVTTAEDDFLAIYAALGSSSGLRELGERYPSVGVIADQLDAGLDRGAPVATPAVTLVSVETPAPADVRAALAGAPGKRLPTVTLAVAATDADGRTLEHAWRIAGGPWRPYRTGDQLVIADRAFAFQAAYTIDVRSRVVGDYTTTSPAASVEILIDSVAPEIRAGEVALDDVGLTVPARDLVTDATLLAYAWGRPGDAEPSTDWALAPTIDRATLDDLVVDGQVAVWVRDEAGNVAAASVAAGFHGASGETGCGCATGGGNAGGLLVLGLVALGLRRRRR